MNQGSLHTLPAETLQQVLGNLEKANREFALAYPGDSPDRQPVHTVYGGAQMFKADTAQKLGGLALAALKEYAPTPAVLAKVLGLKGSAKFQQIIYDRVVAKLTSEPVEDFRIDFEDGYGNRSDEEEDGHAQFAASEVARGMREKSLPPFIGFRIKPLTEDLKARAIRTLDLFISTLVNQSGGTLPHGFVVTLPKVVSPQQVIALVSLLGALESRHNLAAGSLKLEIMIETPQTIFNQRGEVALPALVAASQGRCVAAHFGVYDYTASNNITATYQTMDHPACDFARTVMKVSLAGTGIWLSDGATNVMPVGPHRAEAGKRLTPRQLKENREVVHRAWKLGFDHINHSLRNGYYQGWDLHPSQLPIRYAAVYAFFLQSLESASHRLRTFVEKAAQATLIGEVFDDAATGQGLLNFFLRGIGCGAITEKEAEATGLSVAEIRTRSFLKILQGRRKSV
ncbi:MAG TPA: phosphoenolpyruvate kinase [Bacteroidota bacterium]|nr:phosphoenolpyruvate kinase [Bacteroidota bacterium]